MKRNCHILLPILLCFSLSGCAGVMTQKFPDEQGKININVLAKEDVKQHRVIQDWPFGTYRIPNSNVFIANVQGDEDMMLPDFFFGLAGVAVAGGDIAGNSKKKIKDFEARLTLDTQKLGQRCLAEALNGADDQKRFVLTDKDGETTLRVSPFMVFSSVDKEKARLWVILKASLIDNNFNRVEWKCRYIAGLGKPRPFKGEDSWGALKDGELEKETELDMREAARVMVEDLQGKLRDDKAPTEKINGCWVYFKKPLRVDGKSFFRDDREEIVLPLVGDDEYFAGINILPKDFFQTGDSK